MLVALGIVAVLSAQPSLVPSVALRSPSLDAVRRYGPGTEREAIVALQALRLRDADEVFEELDEKNVAAVGVDGVVNLLGQRVRGCRPQQLVGLSRESQTKVAATWRRLYPRALALHVEALAACNPTADFADMRLHLTVLLRLVVRNRAGGARDAGHSARVRAGRHAGPAPDALDSLISP